MSKPYWFTCPFKCLNASEISQTYNEPQLSIRGYAITYLLAFDVGASNLKARVKPKDVVEKLVDLGYSIANAAYAEELEGVGIRGEALFIKRYFKNKLKNAGKSNFEDLRKEAEKEFDKQTELLQAFRWWDNSQVLVYVGLGRLARAIFPQIKIKLPYDENFRTASVVASVYAGGAACLSLHPTLIEKGLTTDETLKLLEDYEEIEVEVIFPEWLRKLLQHATNLQKAGYGIFSKIWAKIGDMRYKATLADVMRLFMFAVHSAVLETLKWRKSPENYRRIGEAQARGYRLIYLLAGNKPVRDTFQEVVKKHPRQCFGLLARDRGYKIRSVEYVSANLVDTSPSIELSGFLSVNTMLRICADDFWRTAFGMLDAVPTYGVIGDTACFGLLNCLRILHLAYDLLLTRVLGRGVEELVEAENRVVTGLEEIYEARHQIYRSVSDWWWLAEENLGISELNNAINEKLSRIHTIITTKTEQKTNKQLTLITLITAILTAITIIPIIEKYLLPIISPALPTLTNTLPLTLSIIISTIITATAIYIAPHTATALLTILTKIKLTKTTLKPIKTKSKS